MKDLREKYNPDGSLLRNAQLRMLEILCEFDSICRKHELRYWLSDGTLLGAVRHKGFIPWDDDVDVMMPVSDYKKFLKIARKELPEHLCLQNRKTEKNFINNFTKIRDRKSFVHEQQHMTGRYAERGLFIDIFPMRKTCSYFNQQAGKIHYRCYILSMQDERHHRKSLLVSWMLFNILIPLLNMLTPFFRDGKVRHSYGGCFYEEWDEETIFPLTTIQFEEKEFLCPRDCDTYLKAQYNNYMGIPKNIEHHIKEGQIEIW